MNIDAYCIERVPVSAEDLVSISANPLRPGHAQSIPTRSDYLYRG